MKILLIVVVAALCGCQAPAPADLPGTSKPTVRPVISGAPEPIKVPSPVRPTETTSRRQAQWIEALINQNEALAAKLASGQPSAAPSPTAKPAPPVETPAVKVVEPPAFALPVVDAALAPNAEGVIDLAVLANTGVGDEPINPFAVRSAGSEKAREVSIVIGGTVLGAAPCAMINGRLVQVGETVEGFTLERILPGQVVARIGIHQLRLPVSTQPVRVKLPL